MDALISCKGLARTIVAATLQLLASKSLQGQIVAVAVQLGKPDCGSHRNTKGLDRFDMNNSACAWPTIRSCVRIPWC